MRIRDHIRRLVFRLERKKGRIFAVYLCIAAVLFGTQYLYWRSEFSWNEILLMSNLKILFEEFGGADASAVSDRTDWGWPLVQSSGYQAFSASYYDCDERKMYPIGLMNDHEMLHITVPEEMAYVLEDFNEPVTADFYAWDARDKSHRRTDEGSLEVKELRKLTMPSENRQVIPVKDRGCLIVHSVSRPLMPALISMLTWHVLLVILYVFYRYVRWARKTLVSEKEKVRLMRRDMMNAIAHEIRTPLAAIMGYAENLKLGIREDKKDWYLDQIMEKGGQISGMIDDILSLAKLEETGTLHSEKILLSGILQECMNEYPDVQFSCDKNDEMEITADRQYITRMFRCLLDNAVKYRTEGTPVTVYIGNGEIRIHNACDPLGEEQLKELSDLHANKDGRYSFGLYFASKAAEKNGLKLLVYNDGDGVTAQII
ncbi:MAG: HAMP domain-containing histidine kinase [Solobacterium sp.]|nr:HAMP domain-containing histidine kinase [Solobacterium sp.]